MDLLVVTKYLQQQVPSLTIFTLKKAFELSKIKNKLFLKALIERDGAPILINKEDEKNLQIVNPV